MNERGKASQLAALTASAHAPMTATLRQKCEGVAPGAIGEHEAHADERHEHRDDERAEAEPERIVLEVGGDDAVESEIEREVVDEHQAQRETANRIDAGDSVGG